MVNYEQESSVISLLEAVRTRPHTTEEPAHYGSAHFLESLDRLGILCSLKDGRTTVWWDAKLPTKKVVEWLYGVSITTRFDKYDGDVLVSIDSGPHPHAYWLNQVVFPTEIQEALDALGTGEELFS